MNFRTYLAEQARSPEYDREETGTIVVDCGIDIDGKYSAAVEVSFSWDPDVDVRNRVFYGNVDDSTILRNGLSTAVLKSIYAKDYERTETKNGKIIINSDVVNFTLDKRGKLTITSFDEIQLQQAIKEY